jgi:hypothetical protein
MERKTLLEGPDIGQPFHGITTVAENDSFQKIEFSLKETFKR